MLARERAQQLAQADEVGGALGQRGGVRGRRGRARGRLGAVVGGDGVDDEEGGLVPREGDGELVVQDVVLGFEVWGLQGEDAGEGGGGREGGEEGVRAEELGEARGG